ncbi:hypothetical protein TNCV_698391 [Trichonephila clavipes]|nr:hypothetical protein TNCV_698391 [Trichonephila clavipes]
MLRVGLKKKRKEFLRHISLRHERRLYNHAALYLIRRAFYSLKSSEDTDYEDIVWMLPNRSKIISHR